MNRITERNFKLHVYEGFGCQQSQTIYMSWIPFGNLKKKKAIIENTKACKNKSKWPVDDSGNSEDTHPQNLLQTLT